MHPTLARFLDVGKALELLDSPGSPAPDPDAAAFLKASRADPALTAQLRATQSAERPGPDAQQAVVVLAVRAAVDRLADDAVLGPLAKDAAAALSKEGASEAEVTQMLGTVLLEEGFADDGDPIDFDKEFVRETLATLPTLARLDADKVDTLLEGFVAAQPAGARPLALKAADTFLSEAWGDGLQPLASEHVELAVEVLRRESSADDIDKLVDMLKACLGHLEKSGVLGPARTERLGAAAALTLAALKRGEGDEDEDADDADEDEDDSAGPDDENQLN